MSILSWPTLSRSGPPELMWGLQSNTQTFESPLSRAVQTMEMPGARWVVSFTLPSLNAADAAAMRAFLARLRGEAGRFYLHNMSQTRPRGIATGTPLVAGAGQSGTSLTTDGWTPSQAGILKAGDFIGLNGELKMVVADCDSDATGAATVVFEPPLRSSPADNAAIVLSKPTAVFKLDESRSAWTTNAPGLDNFSIAATEVW